MGGGGRAAAGDGGGESRGACTAPVAPVVAEAEEGTTTGLSHLAHEGAPCSKQSAPCVLLPAPGGRVCCGAASGTLRAGARGGLRGYWSRGGPSSRMRGK